VDQFHGQLPSGVNQLRELPGIGRYTAGAIASIAFGQDQAALDGNIRRVLSRVFDVGVPARSPQGERQLWELAWQNLPPGRAGDYNQAIMDLGATICLPKKPTCGACPLEEICLARALGVQEERPVVEPRPASPHYFVTAAVLERDGQVLIARRAENGLLGGLWEFPGGKLEDGETLPDCLSREIDEELGATVQVGDEIGVYRHAYTHFRVTLHAFFCRLAAGEPKANIHSAIAWVDPHRLEDYPMGKIDRKIAQDLIRGIDTPVP
jgi:A/G-specific adenine glycosylase